MCNCFWQKCQQCDEMIPVHITDFCTPRGNLQVFCEKHLPDSDCFIHTVVEPKQDREYDYKKGTKFGFRIVDKTLWLNDEYEPIESLSEEFKKQLRQRHRQEKFMVWDWAIPNICQETKVEVLK